MKYSEALPYTIKDRRPGTCERHGDFEDCLIQMFGQSMWMGCDVCGDEKRRQHDAEEQRLAAQQLAQEAAARRVAELNARGIVGRLQRMTFDSFEATTPDQRKALEAGQEFAASPKNTLLLIGSVGTGKTHLAAAICHQTDGHYQRVMRMVRDIRSGYGQRDKPSEQQRLDHWATVPVLALDEVGVQLATDSERLLIYEVLDERYIREKPTVLVSNQTAKEMGALLGERAMDRLAEGRTIVYFTWPSYRRQQRDNSGGQQPSPQPD